MAQTYQDFESVQERNETQADATTPTKEPNDTLTEAHAELPTKAHKLSVRRLCNLFSISLVCWRYAPKNDAVNQELAAALRALAHQHKTWGFMLMFLYLRNVEKRPWNHKRVYRVYCELGLNLRIKPHARIERDKPLPLNPPDDPNTVWSMDFMHDNLTDGRAYRSLNILDDFNREFLSAEIDLSLPTTRVITALEHIIEWRGAPKVLRSDNGPEFISKEMSQWAESKGIILWFTQPGNPQQNAYIERFNRTMRYELLNAELFSSIEEVQERATAWQWLYNNKRPSMALNGITPAQKLADYQKSVYQPSTLH